MLNLLPYPQKTVYTAGPITGLNYQDSALGWRADLAKLLPDHIRTLSPMRGKSFLKDAGILVGDPNMYPQHAMATAKGIMCRDGNDVMNCDLMIANFLGAEKASVGTAIEFGLAHAYRKPVILVIERDGQMFRSNPRPDEEVPLVNPHWHGMIQAIAGYIVPTLEEAAIIAAHLLTPGL
jgi:nucleoside 2-deoxyribosyltransferase